MKNKNHYWAILDEEGLPDVLDIEPIFGHQDGFKKIEGPFSLAEAKHVAEFKLAAVQRGGINERLAKIRKLRESHFVKRKKEYWVVEIKNLGLYAYQIWNRPSSILPSQGPYDSFSEAKLLMEGLYQDLKKTIQEKIDSTRELKIEDVKE